ncbi:UNVERIFIED_CONTAM: hypothetical protein HDU68_003508 [Siphonaria sp. JEL0065]|nr:hypothetical protein HDU68_003508 [Siphonaria sp. JEL0065]
MFGFFIPAVSGVLSGSSRSAELENPRRDIPRYTIAAQVTTSLVYFFFILLLGVGFDRDTLQINQLLSTNDPSSLMVVLAWPLKWIALAGFIAICLGSAIQGLGSAQKLLQAIANDDVLPILRVFKKTQSESRMDRFCNTWKGRLLGFLVIEFTILVGTADHICHVFAVLYLMCYVFLNASIAVLGFTKSPSWRPTWRYHHWSLSALTSTVSLVFAFFINVQVSLLFFAIMIVILKFVSSHDATSQYGKSNMAGGTAIMLQIAKRNLWEIEAKSGCECNSCDWRPHVLVVVDGGRDDEGDWCPTADNKLEFLSQMKKGGGLSMVLNVQSGWEDFVDTHVVTKEVKKHPSWQSCHFRIFIVAQEGDPISEMKHKLQSNLKGLGISAESDVLVLNESDPNTTSKLFAKVTGLTKVFGQISRAGSRDSRNSETSIAIPTRERVFSLRTVSDLMKLEPSPTDDSIQPFNGIKRQHSPVELTSSETLADSGVTKALCQKRLGLAITLNTLIKSKNTNSKVVLCNLPCPEQATADTEEYIEFLNHLADGLNNIIFVRGTGNELVTDFY